MIDWNNYQSMAAQLDAGGLPSRANTVERPRAFLPSLDISDAWPPLEPLQEEANLLPLQEEANLLIEPFPFEAMGELLGSAAKDIADGVQAPDSLAGGSVLAAASLAVQPLANVVLPHGQRSPLSLYVVTSGESGDRKSGVDRIACAPIERVRKEQARNYQVQLEAYRRERPVSNRADMEPPPAMKALTVADATVQGITKLLRTQSSLGVFSPDGGDVLGGHSMQDKNRMATMAFFLKSWSGESVDTLRAGDGLTSLLGRRIAMSIMVQPVLLRKLLRDPLAAGQGFLARCLISEPRSLAGTRLYRDVNLEDNPGSAIVQYHARLAELLELRPRTHEHGDGYELKPQDLFFSSEVLSVWPGLHDRFEVAMAPGMQLEAARAFGSKAMEHLARLAGVLTMIRNPQAQTIGLAEIRCAAQLTQFYVNEHLRLTGSGRQHRQELVAVTLLRWLQTEAEKCGGTVPKASVLQNSPHPIRDLKAGGINPLLKELQRRGYIRERGKVWEVRPDV